MDVIIVTNGDIVDLKHIKNTLKDKYIICADGASKYLRNIEVIPDLLVGDFDSIDDDDLSWMKNNGVSYEKFPTRKDQTDTELAVEYAIKNKPKTITIIGALGSREDHSLANVMLLYKIVQHDIRGSIIDKNNEIYITKNSIHIEGEIGEMLSIIPITPIVSGVTLKGLEYPLMNKTIAMGSTLGISNIFEKNKVEIHVDEGVLLIIKSKE
ncbi:MAG: thiamine diphosphokinase [Clostridiaceae bacterium]|nr:thiamine diphosphokinase [Clostridiaceae bacterium]